MTTPRDIPRLLRRGIALHAALGVACFVFGLGFSWTMGGDRGRAVSHGEPLFLIGIALLIGVPVLVLEIASVRRLKIAATTHVGSVVDRCRGCGYDLAGGEPRGRCPECGAAYVFASGHEVVAGGTPIARPPLGRQIAIWEQNSLFRAMSGGFMVAAFLNIFVARGVADAAYGASGAVVILILLELSSQRRLCRIARAYATRPLGQCMCCGRDLTDRIRDGTCETCGERFTVRSRG